MKLYEINQEIMDCIDTETGEIIDEEKLHELQIDRHEKLRNIAFVYLNAQSDYKELDEQYKKFKARRDNAKATAVWAKATLERELAGQKMKEAEFTISYRKSESVEVRNVKAVPDEFLIPVEPKVDKTRLKDALKSGAMFDGIELIEKQNIQIK